MSGKMGWWGRMWRRPGHGDDLFCRLLALGMVGVAAWYGGSVAQFCGIAALLLLIVGQLRVLRAQADERWDALHGPVQETLRAELPFDACTLRPGAVVSFGGKEYQVHSVEHHVEGGRLATTRFEARRGRED